MMKLPPHLGAFSESELEYLFFQGMDAESYSLHTFEALLTQSMENLGKTIWGHDSFPFLALFFRTNSPFHLDP